MIEKILNNKIAKLVNIYRFSGQYLNKKESDSDHVWGMNSMAFILVPELNKLYTDESDKLDIKDIIYRITVHDIDECVTFDLPRNFKYYKPELTKAIKDATKEILSNEFDKDFINDIESAKDHTKSGFLVKVLDVVQVILKYYNELTNTGNTNVKQYVKLSLDVLNDHLKTLWDSEFDNIYKTFMNDFITEVIKYSEKYFEVDKLKLGKVFMKGVNKLIDKYAK